jgi:hypothetical protein
MVNGIAPNYLRQPGQVLHPPEWKMQQRFSLFASMEEKADALPLLDCQQ